MKIDIATKVIQIAVMKKKDLQLVFENFEEASLKFFGGSYLRGNAKIKRPITTRRPMHLVMGSSLARGPMSLLRFGEGIERIIYRQARKCGVRVYKLAIGRDHLHLVVMPRSRDAFHSFLRAVSGLIARLVTGAERGSPKGVSFWDARPFTRIVEWGRDYRNVCNYLVQNTLEALGFVKYTPRKASGRRKLSPYSSA